MPTCQSVCAVPPESHALSLQCACMRQTRISRQKAHLVASSRRPPRVPRWSSSNAKMSPVGTRLREAVRSRGRGPIVPVCGCLVARSLEKMRENVRRWLLPTGVCVSGLVCAVPARSESERGRVACYGCRSRKVIRVKRPCPSCLLPPPPTPTPPCHSLRGPLPQPSPTRTRLL